jgi:hypothetical protein
VRSLKKESQIKEGFGWSIVEKVKVEGECWKDNKMIQYVCIMKKCISDEKEGKAKFMKSHWFAKNLN